MARGKSKIWSPWACPVDETHGSTFEMAGGRFYCAHHGHEQLAEQHAGGPRSETQRWFTLEDMERSMGLVRNADGIVTKAEGFGVDFSEDGVEEILAADDHRRCRECDVELPVHDKPGRPPVKCEACRGS